MDTLLSQEFISPWGVLTELVKQAQFLHMNPIDT